MPASPALADFQSPLVTLGAYLLCQFLMSPSTHWNSLHPSSPYCWNFIKGTYLMKETFWLSPTPPAALLGSSKAISPKSMNQSNVTYPTNLLIVAFVIIAPFTHNISGASKTSLLTASLEISNMPTKFSRLSSLKNSICRYPGDSKSTQCHNYSYPG